MLNKELEYAGIFAGIFKKGEIMRKLFLVLCMIIVSSVSAQARPLERTVPFYDTFDVPLSEYKSYSVMRQSYPEEYYCATKDGRLEIHTGDDNYYPTILSCSFLPVVSGRLVIDYTMTIPNGSYLMSYANFPSIVADDGTANTLMTFMGMAAGQTSIYDRPAGAKKIPGLSFEFDKNYKFRFLVDLEKGKYNCYLDKGNGYEKLIAEDGTTDFGISVTNISGVQFRCDSMTSGNNLIYLDDFSVYPDENIYYVSANKGSDQNIGNFDMPFKTPEHAIVNAEKFGGRIILMDGEYELGNDFSYSEIERSYDTKSIILEPYYGADIKLGGNYESELPSLNNKLATEELRKKFLNDIDRHYVTALSAHPVTAFLENVSNDGTYEFELANNGITNENCTVIMCVYDNFGKLISSSIAEAECEAGSREPVSLAVPITQDDCKIKCFMWNSINEMRPKGVLNTARVEGVSNAEPVTLADIHVFGKNITVSGIAPAGHEVSVSVINENGGLVYAGQYPANSDGSFEIDCKTQGLFGEYMVYLSYLEE